MTTRADDRPSHFSMIRGFQLADFFTLGNAACGVGAVFLTMRYLQGGARAHFYAAAAMAPLAFFFAWLATLVFVTLLLTFSGLDILTGFSAAVASLNNIGPGLHEVGPATTFAILTDFQTWVCTVTMLLGRLELITVLAILTPAFWRK